MGKIPRQMIVRNKETGKTGVTVDDFSGPLSVCSPDETMVVYEGETTGTGTPTKNLEVLNPENAIADLKKCGAGTEQCCIFLTVGGNGAECERFSRLRWDIIFRKEKMRAHREPTALYPKCQLEN